MNTLTPEEIKIAALTRELSLMQGKMAREVRSREHAWLTTEKAKEEVTALTARVAALEAAISAEPCDDDCRSVCGDMFTPTYRDGEPPMKCDCWKSEALAQTAPAPPESPGEAAARSLQSFFDCEAAERKETP